MQSDEPAYLTVGTEVSAKFKGAFCEAKVKKVEKSVKCKILLKQPPFGSVTVDDSSINGPLEINGLVEVVQGKQTHKGIIQSVKDSSLYTVVFNDGDERVLRRTHVCLKGGKHFAAEANLDSLPLYNPDTFISSYLTGGRKKKRKSPSESEDESVLNQPSTSNSEDVKNSSPDSHTETPLCKRTASLTTPLKGISSTRSTTRAINALKFETSASKSPTPSGVGDSRLRSNSVQAPVIPTQNVADEVISNSEEEADDDDEENDKTIKEKPYYKPSYINLATTKDSSSRIMPATKEIKPKRHYNKTKHLQNNENASMSRLTQNTISSAKKRLNLTPVFGKEAKRPVGRPKERAMSESRTVVSGGVLAKKSKKLNSETGSIGDLEQNEKIFPDLVVIINEFVPPRTGGRVQLGLVVTRKEYKEHLTTNKLPLPNNFTKKYVPIRSFQNGKFDLVRMEQLSLFEPDSFKKQLDFSSSLKLSFERALMYYNKKELPPSWEKRISIDETSTSSKTDKSFISKKSSPDETISSKNKPTTSKKPSPDDSATSSSKADKPTTSKKNSQSSSESETSSEEEEDENYGEKRDRFVAHFYKFQDESGNPMNRIPILGGKEIDLYRFYDVVNQLGGHKRVSQEMKWRKVLKKIHLKDCSGATPHTVKNAYLRYFEKFEAFLKNLGYSALNGTGPTSTFSRSSRAIRPVYESDWKRKKREKEERKNKEKENEQQNSNDTKEGLYKPAFKRSKSRDSEESSTNASKTTRATILNSSNIPTTIPTLAVPLPPNALQEVVVGETKPDIKNVIVEEPVVKSTERKNSTGDDKKTLQESRENFSLPNTPEQLNLPSKKSIKSEEKKSEKVKKAKDPTKIRKIKNPEKLSKKGKDSTEKIRKTSKSMNPELENITSSEDESKKRMYRRGSAGTKDDRGRSPAGQIKSHPVLEEQDVGYTNAHIFTRFYQGQKVHARHHLRFYDARVITVRQPGLKEIAKILKDTYEHGKSALNSMVPESHALTLQNMGTDLKNALKNMVNSTKCFVHYLGWNSRYDEWLMLHKIRVDEKDELASTNALEALIPAELHPQLFAVAMDWCTSQEGIPSLAHTHAYTSDQQRPRRLSSSVSTSGTQPSNTQQKVFSDSNTLGKTQQNLVGKNLNSKTFFGQNFLGANLKVEKSPEHLSMGQQHQNQILLKSGMDNSSLCNSQKIQTIGDESHVQYSSITQNLNVVYSTQYVKSGTSIFNSSTTTANTKPPHTATTITSGVYSAPPIPPQMLANNEFRLQNSQALYQNQQPNRDGFDSTTILSSSSVNIQRSNISPQTSFNSLLKLPVVAAPTTIPQSYEIYSHLIDSTPNITSSGGSVAPYSVVITPNSSVQAQLGLTTTPSKITLNQSGLLLNPNGTNQLAPSVIPHLKTNEVFVDFESKVPKNLIEGFGQIKVDGKNSTNVSSTIKVVKNEEPPVQNLNKFNNENTGGGGCNMHVLADLASHSAVGTTKPLAPMETTSDNVAVVVATTIETTTTTTEEMDMLTTSNNETPDIPDDTDECASLCSSKIGSPIPLSQQHQHQQHQQQYNRSRLNVSSANRRQQHNLEGAQNSSSGRFSVNSSITTPQQSLRGTKRRSKTPDGDGSSAAEDTYEEIISHTDTSHAVRQRLLQRMEADNLFASYSFIGLPELEAVLQPTITDSSSTDIKAIEKQICRLREIYQTYRGKLTRLERRHKAAVTKKRNQQKENREANNLKALKENVETHQMECS